MAVIKVPNSPYYYSSHMIEGRVYRRSTKTKDKKLANRLDEAYKQELLAKIHLDADEITFGEAAQKFLTSKRRKPDALYNTVLGIIGAERLMSDLSTRDVTHLVDKLRQRKLAEQTCKHHLGFLRQVWKYAKANHFRVRDIEFPTIKVKNNRIRILSLAEESRLLSELDPKREHNGLRPYHERDPQLIAEMQDNYDIVVALLDTGARIGEITGLRWSDIDLEAGTISLFRPKVGNRSILKMTGRLMRAMQNRFGYSKSEWVFSNKKGNRRACNNFAIRKAFKRAGLNDYTIHDLRHVFCAKMLHLGVSLYELSRLLGHSNVNMTARYSYLCEKDISVKTAKLLDEAYERIEDDKISHLVTF